MCQIHCVAHRKGQRRTGLFHNVLWRPIRWTLGHSHLFIWGDTTGDVKNNFKKVFNLPGSGARFSKIFSLFCAAQLSSFSFIEIQQSSSPWDFWGLLTLNSSLALQTKHSIVSRWLIAFLPLLPRWDSGPPDPRAATMVVMKMKFPFQKRVKLAQGLWLLSWCATVAGATTFTLGCLLKTELRRRAEVFVCEILGIFLLYNV